MIASSRQVLRFILYMFSCIYLILSLLVSRVTHSILTKYTTHCMVAAKMDTPNDGLDSNLPTGV